VEAMANGLGPVAPAISPFDEILDGVGSCYSPHSQADFVSSFRSIISSSLGDKGRQACDRAHSLFFYARHLPVPFWFPLDTSPGSADFAAVASGVKLAIGRLTDESSDFKH
jgi:hypothetical protein